MPGYTHPMWYYHLVKLCVFLQVQNQLHSPHAFLEILQRYANFLFWVLWAYLATQTQHDSINLKKSLMFIWMPKIKLIIHFFQFDWVTAFLSITQVADFSQIWDWCWKSITILTFISNYFQEKLITNHTHVKKVGHTTKFLFGICWWTWKTTFYLKNCWSGPIKNI